MSSSSEHPIIEGSEVSIQKEPVGGASERLRGEAWTGSRSSAERGCIAVVLKGYPRLSETFIAQELLELERRGFRLQIISLRHPTDRKRHGLHDAIAAEILYLPEYLHDEPIRVMRAAARCISMSGFWPALRVWFKDMVRDRSWNRIRRFGQALVMAYEMDPKAEQIYAHFLHTPTSVARYTAMLTGHLFSVSAHAKDIWTIEQWEVAEKLQDCEFLVTCTQANVDYLTSIAPDPSRVRLLYHGLDFERFPDVQSAKDSDGSDPTRPVSLLSVGRAVPKKGYDVLLRALAALPAELNWRFEHIGGGELRDKLQALASELGLDTKVVFRGAMSQEELLERYRHADLFVLASRVTEDGDRDGLPNVLMEAQSQGLACVSTRVSAIPELIQHGQTGWLVESERADELADALERLIREPRLRDELGAAG